MNTTFLLLGTNLGNRCENLGQAITHIKQQVGGVELISSIYETEPWGEKDQPAFYNQALKVKTHLSPFELIDEINTIEKNMGRERTLLNKWKERQIDIDILFFNNLVLKSEKLIIPHPSIHLRNFALIPMEQIAAGLIHPLLNKNISVLLAESPDILQVAPVLNTPELP